jgi:hypothetical protein
LTASQSGSQSGWLNDEQPGISGQQSWQKQKKLRELDLNQNFCVENVRIKMVMKAPELM